jgi:hypothetical protein
MGWIRERFGEQAEKLVQNIKNKVVVNDDEHQKRLDICRSCENYTTLHMCKECHCYMPLKTKFSVFECPIKKW